MTLADSSFDAQRLPIGRVVGVMAVGWASKAPAAFYGTAAGIHYHANVPLLVTHQIARTRLCPRDDLISARVPDAHYGYKGLRMGPAIPPECWNLLPLHRSGPM